MSVEQMVPTKTILEVIDFITDIDLEKICGSVMIGKEWEKHKIVCCNDSGQVVFCGEPIVAMVYVSGVNDFAQADANIAIVATTGVAADLPVFDYSGKYYNMITATAVNERTVDLVGRGVARVYLLSTANAETERNLETIRNLNIPIL